jgi:hypothetical protein
MDKLQIANIQKEYGQILKTHFWSVYNERLSSYLKMAIGDCTSKGVSDNPREDFRYYQGKKQAFTNVLGMPDEILQKLKANEE